MRFGVLGPLAVWTVDGEPVRIPERKVRVVLAALLARAGRPVSVDRLTDDLYGADLPANPAGALQTKVSRLRQALDRAEPGARDVVESRSPGYLLRVAADQVDTGRFQELATRARAAGDSRARARLLADALALWRGPAYADLADEPFARAAATRLEEERLTVVEELAEARLELGEHRLLVGELGDLVAAHPLRQRLRSAQLRAMYGAGRHSDALDSYAALRDRLADELGLDPDPELVALQAAILNQDPALAPPSSPRPGSNLPAPVTDLVGREEAVGEVRALLGPARSVTLTGPGGVGKTRLALEVAGGLARDYVDGVWLVDLTGLDRTSGRVAPPEMAELVGSTLGIRDDPTAGRPLSRVDRLVGALRGRELLLVLDNCEHVLDTVARLTRTLLREVPGLHVLATSQVPLGIAAERLWAVPPLDLPDPGAGPAALAGSTAVRFFVARATALAPGFVLDQADAVMVAGICRRLDGIPLALELAAARVRVLGVAELANRLDDRFGVLTAGRRDAPARQQTLRATIEWSWDLLSAPERTLLRRLAVPADGFSLHTAEALNAAAEPGVGAGAGPVRPDALELVAGLVDRSLVVVLPTPTGTRYRLLESVRAYAAERLDAVGEADLVRRRYVTHYAELAETAEPHLYGVDQRHWLERLDAETANIRVAFEAAVQLGDTGGLVRLVNALAWYWLLRGRLTEAQRCLRRALAPAGAPAPGNAPAPGDAPAPGGRSGSDGRAVAAAWRAGIELFGGAVIDPAARRRALASYERVVDPARRARAEWFLAFAHRGFGEPATTAELLDRALADLRALDDRWGTAAGLSLRATLARARGDLAAADRDARASAAMFRELGDAWGQLRSTTTLAELAEIAGDYPRAAGLHRDGLRLAEELQLWGEASLKLSGLGRISLLTGDIATADELHERGMRMAAGQSDTVAEEFAEIGLALGARRTGDLDRAEAHLRRWLDWLSQVDGEPGLALVLAELGFLAELRGDAASAGRLHREGLVAARAIGDPRAVALAFEGLAGARTLAGRHPEAAELLGGAAALRTSLGAPLPDAERADVDRITGRARDALGADAFAAAYDRGAATGTDEIVAALT